MPAGMQVTVALVKKPTAAGSWTSAGVTANVANAGFPIRGWTVGEPVGELLVDDTFGNAQPKDADDGNLNLSGDFSAYARYDSLTVPFALFMGLAGVPVTVAVSGREHNLRWANSIDQLNATVAMDTLTSVDEYPSVKIAGFVLHQAAGQPCELTFNVIANTKRYSTDTGDLPTNTTLAAVTTISPRYRLIGQHLKVRANIQSGIALASPTDDITPNDLTLTVNRAMVGDNVFNGSRVIDEPELDNVPTATLAVSWPVHRAQTDVLLRAAKAGSEFKLDLTWTHPDANGAGTASPYLFRIDIARAKIGAPTKAASGPGRIPYSHTFQLLKPETAPTGMTLPVPLTDMFRIFTRNRLVTDPLA